MSSRARKQANRRNARRSTGPVTAAGRASVRWNALRHGLTAAQAVLPDEDAAELEDFTAAVSIELGAEGALEAMLAERVALLIWRLRRAGRLEGALHAWRRAATGRATIEARWRDRWARLNDAGLYRHEQHAEAAERQAMTQFVADQDHAGLAAGFLDDSRTENTFAKLSRYEATLQRSLRDTLDELGRLQQRREAAAAIEGMATVTDPDAAGKPAGSTTALALPGPGTATAPTP